ncbi:hypothetical protein CRV24_003751 [Beauveria bassiana]|nr:hypothetical protein CRV24_003751 [Beauveria bassiana]
MKSTVLNRTLLALGLSRANVTESEAQLLCGNLGVMKVPDGVDPKSVRTCKEHPSIRDIQDVMKLEKRKCVRDRDCGRNDTCGGGGCKKCGCGC